jgi:glucose/arabinose dehydrogenase
LLAPRHIYKVSPDGGVHTFAYGLDEPQGLAFDSAGNLFVADYDDSKIYEFAPNGVRSTFASGLAGPQGLAFNSAGDLFAACQHNSVIDEFTPGGVQSVFASGVASPEGLAFQPAVVPEPSALGLLAVGATALLVHHRRRCASV